MVAGHICLDVFPTLAGGTLSAACAVGACSVEAVDALSGVRTWSETEARLAAGWARLPIALDTSSTGWRWDTDHNLWIGLMDARR